MATREKSFIFTEEWVQSISNYIKTRKRLHCLTLNELSIRLEAIDIKIKPEHLKVRINSGHLGAPLFVAILSVMGEKDINVHEILEDYKNSKLKND